MTSMPLLATTAVSADGSLFSTASIVALLTLTLMEIVLGIDNVVFVSILVGKLRKEEQKKGRLIGMGLALALRLGLLFGISWVMSLTQNWISLPEDFRPDFWKSDEKWNKTGLTGKDFILLGGGIFLLYKASKEIYEKLEGDHSAHGSDAGTASFGSVIFQIILLDLVFSLDSVITAVGMIPPSQTPLMVIAMLVAVGVMMACAGSIGDFVQRHPSVKILALSFLNLIGVMLIMEGTGAHPNKGYIYSAMAFSLFVELLNMRFRKKRAPVALHEPTVQEAHLAEEKA